MLNLNKKIIRIGNVGGINPKALAEKIVKIAQNKNIKTGVATVFGGGAESIDVDPQGKLYAQRLLSCYLSIDKDSLKKIETLLEIE
jgi:putative aminopeptidase FrvX